MKKILASTALSCVLLCANGVFAYDYMPPVTNDVKDSQTISYSLEKHEWSRTPVDKEDIVFTKYMTKGSGGYSEYEHGQKQYEAGNGSTYEFLDGTNLIGYNVHSLKFYRLNFNGEKITSEELTPDEVQRYFPDVEIVRISQFKNNKIELKKPWFKAKNFMLLNDTNTDFYKYQFEDEKSYQLVRGLFELPKSMLFPRKLVYSHFASRDKMFPTLQIVVKNGI